MKDALAALLLGLLFAAPADAGVVFSRLTVCPDTHRLVFQAMDPGLGRADTLCVDPGSGEIAWAGGPVRGLLQGDADTLLAATLAGVAILHEGRQVGFSPWVGQGERLPGARVATWPATRRGFVRDASRQGKVLADITVFPERYVPLADGALLFLTDAEHPPAGGFLFVDLHSRGTDGIEWLLRRNLEVRGWVVSPDSLRWALAAREHVPDYGGQNHDLLLVGHGRQVASFRVGTPRTLLWDSQGALWHLDTRGTAIRFVREEMPGTETGAEPRFSWTARPLETLAGACPCPPGSQETVWVWMAPGRYDALEPAERMVARVQRDHPQTLKRGWVAPLTDYEFRAVWGGFLSREALMSAIPDPPVPSATPTQVPVGPQAFSGTVEKIAINALRGEASLRSVERNGRTASELWWRYFSHPRWVRLAGPWGLTAAGPGASVDTPRTSP